MNPTGSPFAFDHAELRAKGPWPLLEAAHERTANDVLPALVDLTRVPLAVVAHPPAFTRYADFLASHASPSYLQVMPVTPFRTVAAWVMAPDLVLLLVDRLFGGPGRPPQGRRGRPAGVVERRLVGRIAALFAGQYARAWATIHALDFGPGRYEFEPRLAQLGAPGETMLHGRFSVTLPDGAGGDVELCMPWAPLRPAWVSASSQLPSTTAEEPGAWGGRLRREIQTTSIELTATLSEQRITVSDALGFSVGDVIPIEVDGKVRLHAQGQTLLEGTHGVSRGRYAIKVTRSLMSPSTHEADREAESSADNREETT